MPPYSSRKKDSVDLGRYCQLTQWGSVIHQMAVPVPSISCCVLNHHNLFYQIQNGLAFNRDTCCHLALCLWLLPFHWGFSVRILLFGWMVLDLLTPISHPLPGIMPAQTFLSVIYEFWNKLVCSSLASFSSLVQCSWVKSGTYPALEHLKVLHFGRLQPYLQTLHYAGKALQG